MEFLIITGLSGAGKSRAADVLEDLDYYCVDNMPVALMTRFAEFCIAAGGRFEKVALVTDVREKEGFGELLDTITELDEMDCNCRILYMHAETRTLIKRYKESRRPHPLAAKGGTIEDAIIRETELLTPVRERADYIVDTTGLTIGMLQSELFGLFAGEERKRELDITVMSFGYKQLLHEPFMGGGLWTALALSLVYKFGWFPVFGFCAVMLFMWGICAFFLASPVVRKGK